MQDSVGEARPTDNTFARRLLERGGESGGSGLEVPLRSPSIGDVSEPLSRPQRLRLLWLALAAMLLPPIFAGLLGVTKLNAFGFAAVCGAVLGGIASAFLFARLTLANKYWPLLGFGLMFVTFPACVALSAGACVALQR